MSILGKNQSKINCFETEYDLPKLQNGDVVLIGITPVKELLNTAESRNLFLQELGCFSQGWNEDNEGNYIDDLTNDDVFTGFVDDNILCNGDREFIVVNLQGKGKEFNICSTYYSDLVDIFTNYMFRISMYNDTVFENNVSTLGNTISDSKASDSPIKTRNFLKLR
jgi:hypothetical protein